MPEFIITSISYYADTGLCNVTLEERTGYERSEKLTPDFQRQHGPTAKLILSDWPLDFQSLRSGYGEVFDVTITRRFTNKSVEAPGALRILPAVDQSVLNSRMDGVRCQ